MFTLTKEQKISNLKEQRQLLISKRKRIESQISGIEAKLLKLEINEPQSSLSRITTDGVSDQMTSF